MDQRLAVTRRLICFGNSVPWVAIVAWLALIGTVSAQNFPYTAYVTGEQAYVRSGPGQRYYPTGQIPAGYAVEVYRHDGSAWCAIRPPEGSFSWLSSHQVRTIDAGIVEVVGEGVVARVGSTLSPNRSAVQVLLPKGEHLQVIPVDENDDPRWVRVAAPAGEFRWIAAAALSLQPPVEAKPLPIPSETQWSRQSDRTTLDNQDEPHAFHHLNQTANTSSPGLQFAPPQGFSTNEQTAVTRAMTTDPNAMDVVAGSPAELQLAEYQSKAANLAPPALLANGAATTTPPTQEIPVTSPEISALPMQALQPRVRFEGKTTPVSAAVGSVEELELRLSQAVVKTPQQWELAPLESAANGLLASTTTPSVRAQLREVLQRIARFQQVQQRYNNPPPVITTPPSTKEERDPFAATDEDEPPSSELTGLSSDIRQRAKQDLANEASAPAEEELSSANKPLYDATGLLKPVVSKRAQAPQYALVDEQGKVVSFVTPTPDLNLKPYVGRRIGVHGTRGFMPEYRRAHVTAGRVTPIEGTIRR